jgi:hypothetical protein
MSTERMMEPTRERGSWAVQGCLFGSVGLFAILLVVLVVLAYQRFREETGRTTTPAAPTSQGSSVHPMAGGESPPVHFDG